MGSPAGHAPNAQETHPAPGSPQHTTTVIQQGVSEEEVNRRVAAARTEEKTKLYGDLEKERKAREKLETERNDLNMALETARNEGQRSKKLETRLEELETQLASLPEKFSKVMDDTLDSVQKQHVEDRRRDQLASTRTTLLNSTTDLIPDMVTGNTPEELQASFEKSKARFKEIADAAADKTRKELGAPLREALPQAVNPGGGGAGGGDNANRTQVAAEGGLEDWRKLSGPEWEAKKKLIKEDAFRKAGLPMKVPR